MIPRPRTGGEPAGPEERAARPDHRADADPRADADADTDAGREPGPHPDPAPAEEPDPDPDPGAEREDQATAEMMRLLHEHVPLTLLADLAERDGPPSPVILEKEGLPDVAWWEDKSR